MLSTFHRRSFLNRGQINFESVGTATSRVDKTLCLFRYGIYSHLLKEVKNYPMSDCWLFHIDRTRPNSKTK